MKLELDKLRKIYFLGIGGIGMSALARFFQAKGIVIHGYDKTPSALTDELMGQGMVIHFNDDPSAIPGDVDLVIYTPAVPRELGEFRFLKESGIPMFKRSQIVGKITEGKMTVAVAGTHGKTSISSLIAHILKSADYPMTALIGGISKNYQSNFISTGKEDIMVVEADEYDRSFLYLHPDIAVISAMDPDHLDIYGTAGEMNLSFNEFARNIKLHGKLIYRKGLQICPNPDTPRVAYAAEEDSDISAFNLRPEKGLQLFDINIGGQHYRDVQLKIPGKHNVENALAAIAVCISIGMEPGRILEAIRTFTGVRRRFEVRIQLPGRVYIDDYAHHPQELEAFISAVRLLYPGKKITGLFQPHLYSRTKDFAAGFAQSLDLLDETWLLDIYPARELPVDGVSSELILDLMHQENKKLLSRTEVLKMLQAEKPEIFLTMGAGDIDLMIEPITKILIS
jgi:UDP-N-acetylmuramate--alanine ligase